jgi:CRP-like cAMP-binding protein
MWLQITLMTAAFLSHYHHPYVLVSDNHQEQMTFLGLALTLSITNSGIVYSGTWRWFHVLVVLAVVFTITAYFAKIQYKSYYEKKDRTARVKKGEQNLTQFTREVFSAAVPTFLLLPDEDRHAIRLLLQVETFQKGDVLYHQGDVANAFYLIKEGSITLRTSLYDSSKELSSDANGDHYEQLAVGAGALLNKPQRRNATAVASSPTLVCLRIIRTDWLKYWTPITEKVAKQLFDSIDKNNNGFISADELRSKLSARWTQVSEEENKKVGSKESTAFNEQLLKSTVDRLINLMDVDRSGTIEFAE